MKRINFLTNAMIPGALYLDQWDTSKKDVFLPNDLATREGIAEMNLNIACLTAISKDGEEHTIMKFSEEKLLNIQGVSSGKNIRTTSLHTLPNGRYSQLRFYLNPQGNTYMFKDGSHRVNKEYDYLDFEIEGELEIGGGQVEEYLLRFDLPHTLDRFINLFVGNRQKVSPANAC